MSGILCGTCERPFTKSGNGRPCECLSVAPVASMPLADDTPGSGSAALKTRAKESFDAPVRRSLAARERPPSGWSGTEPSLQIPEWRSIGAAEMSMADASRHCVVMGESGAGKSVSAVLPFAKAVLRYPAGPGQEMSGEANTLRAAMLVVDPKRELGDALARANEVERLERRVVSLDCNRGNWRIWLFERAEPLAMTANEVVTAILSVSPQASLQRARTNEAFFGLQAERALEAFVAVDLALYKRGGGECVEAFWTDVEKAVRHERLGSIGTSDIVTRVVDLLTIQCDTYQSSALNLYATIAEAYGVDASVLRAPLSFVNLAVETYTSIVATLLGMTNDIRSDRFRARVSVDPFSSPPEGFISIGAALSGGWVVVHTPGGRTSPDTAVCRAIKRQYFRLSLVRETTRPFIYICDEAQRFITTDPDSGEQSFLDRARAYRICCMLATQSAASLRHAMAEDPVAGRADLSVEVLLANTATKMFFRTTDSSTQDLLRSLLPSAPASGSPHVVDVRPVSSLAIGEAYLLYASGAWGRAKVNIS